MEIGVRLITATPLSAVRLSPVPSGGTFTRIPDHEILETRGDSSFAGMVEVTWQGERYATFAVDLDERCVAAEEEPGRAAESAWS